MHLGAKTALLLALSGAIAGLGLGRPAWAEAAKPKLSERFSAAKAAAAAEPAARAAARAKAIADAKANEPDWSKDYAGHESGDIESKPKPLRFVRSEWRANRFEDGKLLTEWEVRILDTGEAIRWGVYRRYHPNGRLAVLGAYRNNRPAGVWMWMDESGQVMRRARQQADYEDDLASDPISNPRSQFRNPTGQVIAEGQLKGDKPHGLWMYYYDDGSPKAQGRYLSGLADGQWSFFYPDGQIRRQETFALGVPVGEYRATYPTGLDEERGQYDEGVRTGIWRTFYPNGQEREVGAYREDQRVGEWKSFDDSGRLTARTKYSAGLVAENIPVPPPPAPPEPLVSGVEELTPPAVFDKQGHRIRTEEDWDAPSNASDASGNPIPLTPPRRRPAPPPLSRWTDPMTGATSGTMPQ